MASLTCTVMSQALGMETPVTIVTPRRVLLRAPGGHEPDWPDHPGWEPAGRIDNDGRPGVLYLLHGLRGTHDVWLRYGRLDTYADKHNLIIVCPTGYRSYWINQHRGLRVADWVSLELPAFIGDTFRIDTNRSYIAGLSMGGFGAMYLAMRRPELYRAAMSFSGVLDTTDADGRTSLPGFYHNSLGGLPVAGSDYDLISRLPEFAATHTVRPRLWVSCGTDDNLMAHSRRFVTTARTAGLDVTDEYTPGRHDFDYWGPVLGRALDAMVK